MNFSRFTISLLYLKKKKTLCSSIKRSQNRLICFQSWQIHCTPFQSLKYFSTLKSPADLHFQMNTVTPYLNSVTAGSATLHPFLTLPSFHLWATRPPLPWLLEVGGKKTTQSYGTRLCNVSSTETYWWWATITALQELPELIYAILFTHNVKPPWCSCDSLNPCAKWEHGVPGGAPACFHSMGRWARVR